MGITAFNQSFKVMEGGKREYADTDDWLELGSKRPKIKDLDSVFRSEESVIRKDVKPIVVGGPRLLDLNASVATGRDETDNKILARATETDKAKLLGRQEINFEIDSLKTKRFMLDLNAEDVSSSINNDPHLGKNDENMGRSEEREPLRLWKEMKQNGFISSSHGGVPMPKPRGRKVKTDGIKKKMEIAKRDQLDRFAKIAAPSGLLNELNPGIINHVRNRKQVYSIIEALVKSEKHGNYNDSKSGGKKKFKTNEFSIRKSEMEHIHNKGENISNQEVGSVHAYTSRQMHDCSTSTNKSVSMNSILSVGDGVSFIKEPGIVGGINSFSNFNTDVEDDMLELKLSSYTRMHSENISSLTCEESVNFTGVSSLSVKAAGVASQWLALLRQDVEGRLAALRRSKKRVHEVIHTELPSLVSKEFPSTRDHNTSMIKGSVSHSNHGIAEAHQTSWGTLFHQMDKSLSEEEKRLENWLNQVTEMQVHCHPGIFKTNAATSIQQMDRTDIDCR
ncbi:hypothetical protein Leryth_008301 [Lithospermum erythrorhizon]|nr:hypothetical protein Leryth_008301 [Lithospermum erythrorhizon]